MMSLDHRGPGLFTAVKWSYAANTVNGVTQLVTVMILARVLEPQDFGAYGILLAVLGLGGLIFSCGLPAAIVQRPSLTPRHVTLALTISGIAAVLGALAIGWGASPLANLFDAPEVAPVLAFGAPILIVNVLNAIGTGLVRRAMDFRWLAFVGVLTFVGVFAPVASVLALAGAGVWSLLCASAAQTLANSVALFLRFRHMGWQAPASIRDSAELFKYGSKTAFYNVLNSAENAFVNFAILDMFGLTELGIFNRVNRVREIAQERLGMAAVGVVFAHFARVHGSKGNLPEEFRGSLALANTVMMPLFFGAATASDVIVTVVLGEKFIDGVNLLTWLFLMAPVIVNQSVASNVVVITGRLWPSIRAQAIFLALFGSGVTVLPMAELESFVILWTGLVFVRYVFYSAAAMQATGIGLPSFLALHLLGVWQTGVVCGALVAVGYVFAPVAPALLLPLLMVVGAAAMGLGFLIAPAGLYVPTLVQAAFHRTEGRFAPLRWLLTLKFGPAATRAAS